MLEVYVCQLIPEIKNPCKFYGYISTADKSLTIKLTEFFEIGKIYGIEVSDEDHYVSVDAGTILVNKKACAQGECIPLAFPTMLVKLLENFFI